MSHPTGRCPRCFEQRYRKHPHLCPDGDPNFPVCRCGHFEFIHTEPDGSCEAWRRCGCHDFVAWSPVPTGEGTEA